jgi:2-keto-4-pentenoate hydratase/2-oxohepta-3-ene-1,7-dioic acid hydratase in catechol pathway
LKIVVFGEDSRVGALVADQVVDVNRAFAQRLRTQGHENADETAADRTPADLKQFITVGQSAIDDAQEAIEFALTQRAGDGVIYQAGAVRLRAPWTGGRIACGGGNFAKHLLGMFGHLPGHENDTVESITKNARELPQWGFWKVPHEVGGPDDSLPFPSHSTYLDYEGEAAIVIAQRGKNIPAADIEKYVWGVTLLNDWSTRERRVGPNYAMSYNVPKNFDGSTSIGPCIVVGEQVDFQNLDIETKVNGDLRQSYSTSEMIFSFGEILEFLSRDFTFLPGDVISGGTNAGTAADKTPPGPDGTRAMDLFLKVGDTVEITSPKIGTLRNLIARAS